MNETPYETRLLALIDQARKAKDQSTLQMIENMLEQVRAAQYGPLQCQFPFLPPSYRIRLGVPPNSREEDLLSGDATQKR